MNVRSRISKDSTESGKDSGRSDYMEKIMSRVKSVKEQLNESENYVSTKQKEEMLRYQSNQSHHDSGQLSNKLGDEFGIYELIGQLQTKLKERLRASQNLQLSCDRDFGASRGRTTSPDQGNNISVEFRGPALLRSINFLETLRDELCEQSFINNQKPAPNFDTFNRIRTNQTSDLQKLNEYPRTQDLSLHRTPAYSDNANSHENLSKMSDLQKPKQTVPPIKVSLKSFNDSDQAPIVQHPHRKFLSQNSNDESRNPNSEILTQLKNANMRNQNLEKEIQILQTENDALSEKLKTKSHKIADLQKLVEQLQLAAKKETNRSKSPSYFSSLKAQHNYGQYSYIHRSNYQR
jgi:hypothetical protein